MQALCPLQAANMAMFRGTALVLILSFSSCYSITPSSASSHGFLCCMWEKIPSELIFTQGSGNFTDVLLSSIRDLKFATNTTVRPLSIVTPTDASHVQAAVRCGRAHGVRLRVRSGGHDYEGLSYRSLEPEVFTVVDLAHLRSVSVNADGDDEWPEPTALVDSGATIGELYYHVAKNNSELAFPAGVCPTMGVGGHFSGGGMGMMVRRFGLSIDHVVDAKLVDADGDLLDRSAMGEDLFWAIRGGGGGSFGIVVSWKVTLVRVPSTVTVVNIVKTFDKDAIDVLTKWQRVAPTLPSDIQLRTIVLGRKAVFQTLYLGPCHDLLPTMKSRFRELNMTSTDCHEMTWLQSMVYINLSNPNTPVEELLNRRSFQPTFGKKKSDYVRQPISKSAWRRIIPWLTKDGAGVLVMEPHGGFVGTVPADATPYSHRSGVLYNIQYVATWSDDAGGSAATSWIDGLYSFMGKHVTKNPREAYVNYRDLDIGQNMVVNGVSAFQSSRVWGERYFGAENFERLAKVKRAVDPTDYFRNEQSIPPWSKSY